MNTEQHIEELVEAACETFWIPAEARDEFADSVHEMVEIGLEVETSYGPQDFLRDLRGYLNASQAPENTMHLSDYAAFTAGYILALEYAEKVPALKMRIARALAKKETS